MIRSAPILALLLAPAAHAAVPIQNGGNLGLGLGGGMGVTGLSGKYFIGQDFSLQLVAGAMNPIGLDPLQTGIADSAGAFAVSFDVLFESQPAINGEALDVAFNWGIGVAGVPAGLDKVGLSVIGGLEFDFEAIPLDIVLEYRPNIWLLPWPGDQILDHIDWIAFTAHIRVYPFPAGANE